MCPASQVPQDAGVWSVDGTQHQTDAWADIDMARNPKEGGKASTQLSLSPMATGELGDQQFRGFDQVTILGFGVLRIPRCGCELQNKLTKRRLTSDIVRQQPVSVFESTHA